MPRPWPGHGSGDCPYACGRIVHFCRAKYFRVSFIEVAQTTRNEYPPVAQKGNRTLGTWSDKLTGGLPLPASHLSLCRSHGMQVTGKGQVCKGVVAARTTYRGGITIREGNNHWLFTRGMGKSANTEYAR